MMLHTVLSVSLAVLAFSSFTSSTTSGDSEVLTTKRSEAAEVVPNQCDRGDSYHDGCDWCKCTPHGYICVPDGACAELKSGLPASGPIESLGRSKRYVYRCRPGSTRQASDCCNTCTCTAEGHWRCSRRWCVAVWCRRNDRSRMRRSIQTPERVDDNNNQLTNAVTDDVTVETSGRRLKRSVPLDIDNMMERKLRPWQCEHGQSTTDGCNRCWCTSRGIWRCTLRACPIFVRHRFGMEPPVVDPARFGVHVNSAQTIRIKRDTDDVTVETSGSNKRSKRSLPPNYPGGISGRLGPWRCQHGQSRNEVGCKRCYCFRGQWRCYTARDCPIYSSEPDQVSTNAARLNRLKRDIYIRGRYPSFVPPSRRRVTPEEKCVSKAHFGRGYNDGCNYCLCYGIGQAICTKRPCRT